MSDADLELLNAYRTAALDRPDVEERVHKTEVQYVRQRIFTSGFVKSHRLEIAVDLLRSVEHPLLRGAFHTTKKVITHRFTISQIDELDGDIVDWVAEAHDTVGRGTR